MRNGKRRRGEGDAEPELVSSRTRRATGSTGGPVRDGKRRAAPSTDVGWMTVSFWLTVVMQVVKKERWAVWQTRRLVARGEGRDGTPDWREPLE